MCMLESIMKATVIYVVLIAYMRLMGKRQLGELEPSELIVTVLLSEVAGCPITDPDATLLDGLVPLTVLFLLEYLLSHITLKNVKLRRMLYGHPSMLVVHGRIDQKQMRKNRFTPDELTEALRNQGVLDMQTVEYAVLETDGRINIILKPGERTVTAAQMGLSPPDDGYPFILINNGRVLSKNLSFLGRDMAWLNTQLQLYGIDSSQNVYLMTGDMAGNIFLAPLEQPQEQ